MRAVANAGPLNHLSWIDRLDILDELFDEILVLLAVQQEVMNAALHIPGVMALHAALAAGRLKPRSTNDPGMAAALVADFDRGESEAIAPIKRNASRHTFAWSSRARINAQYLGFPFTGTIGILMMARGRGLIPEVLPILVELRRRGFRIGTELMDEVQREKTRDEV